MMALRKTLAILSSFGSDQSFLSLVWMFVVAAGMWGRGLNEAGTVLALAAPPRGPCV